MKRYLFFDEDKMENQKEQQQSIVLLIIFLLALATRLLLAPFIPGYVTDVRCFKGWADQVAKVGFSRFYSSDMFVDYPPGYILILYPIGKIRLLFNLDFNSPLFLLLIKLPSLITDLATGYLLLCAARKAKLNFSLSLLLILYLFNPAILINSAVWGQVDSFFTFFVLLSLWFIEEKRFPLASSTMVYALLVKPQALFFFPILLFALLENKNWKTFFKGVVSGLVVLFLVILPFSWGNGIYWLIQKYQGTISSYPYASLNAFNFFALTGGNWVEETHPFLFLNYKTWGYIFLLTISGTGAFLFFRWKNPYKIYPLSFFLISSIFMFSSKMHERYLYPALILALLVFVYFPHRRILLTYSGFSITHFLNVGLVLLYSWYNVFHLPRYSPYVLAISLSNLLLYVYALYAGFHLFQNKKPMTSKESQVLSP